MVEHLQEERWSDLFLKLRCLNPDVLGEFDKVLFPTRTPLVQQSVLPLFELPAPAGHVAGCTAEHGELVKDKHWPPGVGEEEVGSQRRRVGHGAERCGVSSCERRGPGIDCHQAVAHSGAGLPDESFLRAVDTHRGRVELRGSEPQHLRPRKHSVAQRAKLHFSSDAIERRNNPRVCQAVRLWNKVAEREAVKRAASVIHETRGLWVRQERTVSERVAKLLLERGSEIDREWRLPLQLKYVGTRVVVAGHEGVLPGFWRRLEQEWR